VLITECVVSDEEEEALPAGPPAGMGGGMGGMM